MNKSHVTPHSPFATALRRHAINRRGAAALLCAMTAAVVLLSISSVAIRTSLRARQERKTEKDLIQTEFLLDAGMLRAQQQLADNGSYTGEKWMDIESPVGTGRFVIEIVAAPVTLPDAKPIERSVTVTARIDDRIYSPIKIQNSRTETITLNP